MCIFSVISCLLQIHIYPSALFAVNRIEYIHPLRQ